MTDLSDVRIEGIVRQGDPIPKSPSEVMALLGGVRFIPSTTVPAGTIIMTSNTQAWVGDRELTEVEHAGAEARYLVRQGYANMRLKGMNTDILGWLGLTAGREPKPSDTYVDALVTRIMNN